MTAPELETILARPDVWRGRRARWAECHATGFARLDAALDGGWPVGVLIECLGEHGPGRSMALFLPVLKRLLDSGRVVFIDPPYRPYAPALAQTGMALSRLLILRPESAADWLWAGVQCLQSDTCQAVLLWHRHPEPRALRRLQLAAEDRHALAVVLCAPAAARQASPAALRLAVNPHPEGGLAIDVMKCQGQPPQSLWLGERAPGCTGMSS